MGWVLSAFALGYALCQTPAGWLADRLGPRRILAAIVVFWSVFTGLTAAAVNLATLLAARFVFGAGEAGAFPGVARAIYSWIPLEERGLVQGINFSGARLGAAFAMPLVAFMIGQFGWRASFVILMMVGFVWAVCWLSWFRDEPAEHPRMEPAELEYILSHRQQRTPSDEACDELTVSDLTASTNLWILSLQYFCSNFTFFFALTWLFPHLQKTYSLGGVEAGLYTAAPLVGGAVGNWFSGWLVDRIYRIGRWEASRRVPAIVGFGLSAIGLVGNVYAESAWSSIVWFSLAIFGADMTISPSWSVCIDIGKRHAGMVSGTMNMAGNLGSFVTALAFPYLAAWTGSYEPFFFIAAGLNILGAVVWTIIDPRRPLGNLQ
jgi:ACS family glucarate transporter-like MFS transporter